MKSRKKAWPGILFCIIAVSIGLSACGRAPAQKIESNDIDDSNLGQWGRALSAIPMERNEMDPYYFGGLKESNISAEVTREILLNSWNINTREDLLYQIYSLLYKGDRFDYLADSEYLNELSDQDLETFVEVVDEELKIYLTETLRNKEKWGNKGILAWDMCRISLLAQWGYEAGYLTKEEAHGVIEPAADLIKENFISWEEVQQSYLDGFAWWAEVDIKEEGNEYFKRLAIYDELKLNENTINPLFDDNLFDLEILPVEGVSYEDLLAVYE